MTTVQRHLGKIAFMFAAACQQANPYSHSQNTSGTTITSDAPPETIFDPVTGQAAPAGTEVIKLNPAGTLDLRPDAAKAATQPAPDPSLDPRGFVPAGAYKPGAGLLSRSPLSGQIAVPSDGKWVEHPVCAHPAPAPGDATPLLTIDGDLSDWPAENLVAIDRASDAESPDLDLQQVYFARDDKYVYVGVQMGGAWATTYTSKELRLQFDKLTVPSDSSTDPTLTNGVQYQVRGNQLFANGSQVPQGTGAGQVDYSLAVSGSGIELKIARSTVEISLGSTYAFSTMSFDYATSKWDKAGAHLVGFSDDYACLVPTPTPSGAYSGFKMVVFRRAGTVDPAQAEVAYRAFLAAMQETTFSAQDDLAVVDTIPVTVSQNSGSEGALLKTSGSGVPVFFLKLGANDGLGDGGTPREYFRESALLYAFAYSALDYQLPNTWTQIGYAKWQTYQTLSSYYGQSVAQFERYLDFQEYQEEEAANPTATGNVDAPGWNLAPFSQSYYYNKAAAYFSLLARRVNYSELQQNILLEGRRGWPLYDSDDFLDYLKKQPSYSGTSTDDLKTGWLGGAYSPAAALPSSLMLDSDGDGLFDYQEADLGTSAKAIDTAKSGISDLSILSFNLSPKTLPGLRSIAIDNYLADWDLLVPGAMSGALATQGSRAACGDFSAIKRFGVFYVEGWLVVPIELLAVPTLAQEVQVDVIIDVGGKRMTLSANWGSQYVLAAGTSTSGFRMPAPFTGKTIEIAANAAFLGWADGSMPGDAQVYLATFAKGKQCDISVSASPTPTL